MKISVLTIGSYFSEYLVLHSKCGLGIEQCTHTIFVRENVKNCIFS